MIGIREATKADRDAILALRRRCFPNEDLEKQDPRFWDWEFANGRMFLAEEDHRAVAHLGFVPREHEVAGQRLEAALAVDAMTDPDYRRRHLFDRVAAFARDAIRKDFRISTAWQIRKAVLPPMVRNGWQPVLRAPVFARVVSLSSQPHPGAGDVLPQYTTFSHASGFIRVRRTVLKGFDTLALADLHGTHLRPLLRDALAHARALRVQLAAALLSVRHPALPLLLSAGFLPSPHRFRFLVNSFDPGFDPRRVRWELAWTHTDHL